MFFIRYINSKEVSVFPKNLQLYSENFSKHLLAFQQAVAKFPIHPPQTVMNPNLPDCIFFQTQILYNNNIRFN